MKENGLAATQSSSKPAKADDGERKSARELLTSHSSPNNERGHSIKVVPVSADQALSSSMVTHERQAAQAEKPHQRHNVKLTNKSYMLLDDDELER